MKRNTIHISNLNNNNIFPKAMLNYEGKEEINQNIINLDYYKHYSLHINGLGGYEFSFKKIENILAGIVSLYITADSIEDYYLFHGCDNLKFLNISLSNQSFDHVLLHINRIKTLESLVLDNFICDEFRLVTGDQRIWYLEINFKENSVFNDKIISDISASTITRVKLSNCTIPHLSDVGTKLVILSELYLYDVFIDGDIIKPLVYFNSLTIFQVDNPKAIITMEDKEETFLVLNSHQTLKKISIFVESMDISKEFIEAVESNKNEIWVSISTKTEDKMIKEYVDSYKIRYKPYFTSLESFLKDICFERDHNFTTRQLILNKDHPLTVGFARDFSLPMGTLLADKIPSLDKILSWFKRSSGLNKIPYSTMRYS